MQYRDQEPGSGGSYDDRIVRRLIESSFSLAAFDSNLTCTSETFSGFINKYILRSPGCSYSPLPGLLLDGILSVYEVKPAAVAEGLRDYLRTLPNKQLEELNKKLSNATTKPIPSDDNALIASSRANLALIMEKVRERYLDKHQLFERMDLTTLKGMHDRAPNIQSAEFHNLVATVLLKFGSNRLAPGAATESAFKFDVAHPHPALKILYSYYGNQSEAARLQSESAIMMLQTDTVIIHGTRLAYGNEDPFPPGSDPVAAARDYLARYKVRRDVKSGKLLFESPSSYAYVNEFEEMLNHLQEVERLGASLDARDKRYQLFRDLLAHTAYCAGEEVKLRRRESRLGIDSAFDEWMKSFPYKVTRRELLDAPLLPAEERKRCYAELVAFKKSLGRISFRRKNSVDRLLSSLAEHEIEMTETNIHEGAELIRLLMTAGVPLKQKCRLMSAAIQRRLPGEVERELMEAIWGDEVEKRYSVPLERVAAVLGKAQAQAPAHPGDSSENANP